MYKISRTTTQVDGAFKSLELEYHPVGSLKSARMRLTIPDCIAYLQRMDVQHILTILFRVAA